LPSYLRDWFTQRAPGDYWSALDVSNSFEKINIPALHISGWYDTYLSGSIAGFRALRKKAATTHARDHQYLVAGPWIHIPWGDQIGEANFGREALLDTDEILLRWFNHWLKDSEEFVNEPRVRHFALGCNRWFAADEWPEAETSLSHTLYLGSNGRANSRKGDGRLTTLPPSKEEPWDVFVYDPDVPVIAPGGLQALSGAYDQARLELANDVLVYTTEPFVNVLYIFGEPTVVLYAQTSAPAADFVVKLVRVLANGTAQFLAIGIARSTWAFPDGYSQDTIHRWQFSIEPLSCLFASGECLRVEVASSAFPLYDRNPSNDTPPHLAGPWNWRRSTQFVLHSKDYPSAIHLPLASASAHEGSPP
jgi:hypothetical protein